MTHQNHEFNGLLRTLRNCTDGYISKEALNILKREYPEVYDEMVLFARARPQQFCKEFEDVIENLIEDTKYLYRFSNRSPWTLAYNLNTKNLATYSHIPYRRARYIPENLVDGMIMRVYNKNTLERIHREQGISPYTRRKFWGGLKIPQRLRAKYMKQYRQQVQQNVMNN